MNNVGFWWRYLGCIIDVHVVAFMYLLAVSVFDPLVANYIPPGGPLHVLGFFLLLIIIFGIPLCYLTFFDSSKYQGTIGKCIIGAKVVDSQGGRLTFSRSFARNFIKLSIIVIPLLNILFIIVGLNSKKRGIHDMCANTSVIKR